MECYIVQLDFSAAFDRVRHCDSYSNRNLLVWDIDCQRSPEEASCEITTDGKTDYI